ncbi:MAG: copper resistance protein B, partial [Caulobacteraceae bacterium]|nr:copper resistance protein B [Caulobacteraceae bacterium]
NPVGNASPPQQPASFAADSVFDPDAMARARAQLHSEHGGSAALSKATINLAEWQVQDGQNSYRWGGEAWIGGDLQRLVFKSEGEGAAEEGLEQAELQALYSAAIDPYFDLQFGIRQDLASGPRRTYATMGVEGLAPYWVDLQAAAFLSTHGEVLARLEASWDLRLTQRWILQTRAEADLSAQTAPALELGSGLTSLEAGLRLRYQTTRRVAPYFGISSVRMFGGTASRARLTGRDVEQTGLIFGVTTWF